MTNVSHKKRWIEGVVQLHVDSPPIPLININFNMTLEESGTLQDSAKIQ